MSASPASTIREPVLLASDSKQVAYNRLFDSANFAVKESLYIHAGPDPPKSCTLKYVQSLTIVQDMKHNLVVGQPSILLDGVEAEIELLYAVADHIEIMLLILASMTMVLLANLDCMEVSNFIVSALVAQIGFRLVAGPMVQFQDSQRRPNGFPGFYIRRLLRERRRAQPHSVHKYPTINLYPMPPCPFTMLAVQYEKTWETGLHYLRYDLKHAVVVPRPDIEHTKVLFREFRKDATSLLVEQFGRQPRVAVM